MNLCLSQFNRQRTISLPGKLVRKWHQHYLFRTKNYFCQGSGLKKNIRTSVASSLPYPKKKKKTRALVWSSNRKSRDVFRCTMYIDIMMWFNGGSLAHENFNRFLEVEPVPAPVQNQQLLCIDEKRVLETAKCLSKMD